MRNEWRTISLPTVTTLLLPSHLFFGEFFYIRDIVGPDGTVLHKTRSCHKILHYRELELDMGLFVSRTETRRTPELAAEVVARDRLQLYRSRAVHRICNPQAFRARDRRQIDIFSSDDLIFISR